MFEYQTIPIILTFGIGRFLFTWIHHSDRQLLIWEAVSAVFWMIYSIGWTANITLQSNGIILAVLYLASAAAARWIARMKKTDTVRVGIIEFSWVSVLALTCGGIIYAQQFDILSPGVIQSGRSPAYYGQTAAEMTLILEKTVDLASQLALVLAACMGILWAEDLWRRGEKSKLHYVSSTRASISMVFAYLIIIVSTAIWIVFPLFRNLNSIKQYL